VREHADWLPHEQVRVTASFGVTSTQGRRGVSALELLREADVALYQAKQGGRDQVKFYAAEDGANGMTQASAEVRRQKREARIR
jgi:diguanylate cyclase